VTCADSDPLTDLLRNLFDPVRMLGAMLETTTKIKAKRAGAAGASPTIVIGAGGTGGHIYPGLALAEAIREVAPGAQIIFTGTERGLERRLVPAAGFQLRTFDMIPFAGRSRYLMPAALVRASLQARRLLRWVGADVAIGMGGYSSAPLIAGARLAGVPSLIHESNAVPGRANRFSARFTRNVAVAFEASVPHFRGLRDYRVVGMPLMPELAAFDRAALRDRARRRLGVTGDTCLVMVNGGSQGATRLNEAAVELAARWRNRADLRFVVKAGREGSGELNRRLAAAGAHGIATAVDYIDRMDLAYAASDLMVCRAGSATVAELGRVGLPAVLVPYPHAPHDHQTRNARVLADGGAAVLLPDAQVGAERLGEVLGPLIADPVRRARMGAAARATGQDEAAARLAAWVLELIDKEGR
jgi:UDP-N-acetylglucosamine--N-acetylmuramyl-(pentapeptide) pyrophosphoryl-undecaprenol N-acetylglucosamine transferase